MMGLNIFSQNDNMTRCIYSILSRLAFQGLNGNQGSKGLTGDVGARGNKGERGVQGTSGDKGTRGSTGAKGRLFDAILVFCTSHDNLHVLLTPHPRETWH